MLLDRYKKIRIFQILNLLLMIDRIKKELALLKELDKK